MWLALLLSAWFCCLCCVYAHTSLSFPFGLVLSSHRLDYCSEFCYRTLLIFIFLTTNSPCASANLATITPLLLDTRSGTQVPSTHTLLPVCFDRSDGQFRRHSPLHWRIAMHVPAYVDRQYLILT
ncbi:hypothetical protein M431DRAFT_244374 [Trichoderma harzianum CBS 226.95]|uniref:Secreted protein n=1 Tax=Trichoderma harzianum CBS 226.95 TaxID=983964 RepID=A0A2T4A154_TRIHA|nr:hypothetical protein M431DRAFT_244374 [Trichoderma harzianum CBS 226.95]PTB50703.1 hypothetical protein M431DRAFT_244374 [Trichoderma harzianum CBS 226.95]